MVKADADVEEQKAPGKRLGQMEILQLVDAASDARKALDQKMERYMELEDMMAELAA